jgi:VWFA-related protein
MAFGIVVTMLASAIWGEVQRRPPTFRATAELVRLDVLAMDRGRPLRGLTADDFEVRDNGMVQKFQLTAADQLPLELLLVFDTSASVRGAKLDALRACGRAAAQALREGDQLALVTFSDVIGLRCPMTGKSAQLLSALAGLQAGGNTALFDAVLAGLALSSGRSSRPLLLLFSDGRDNVSWLSASDVIAAARLSETPVYAVSTSSIGEATRSILGPPTWASVAAATDDEFLRRITQETGGRVFQADSAAGLKKHFTAVMDEIGTRYLIGYSPEGVAKDGWHRVDVHLRHRRGAIVARPGYSSPTPPGGGQ